MNRTCTFISCVIGGPAIGLFVMLAAVSVSSSIDWGSPEANTLIRLWLAVLLGSSTSLVVVLGVINDVKRRGRHAFWRILKWSAAGGSLMIAITWLLASMGVVGGDWIWLGKTYVETSIQFLPTLRVCPAGHNHTALPFSLPLIVAIGLTVLLWRRDRRVLPGHCHSCGYDLTGNVSGLCPECGRRVLAMERMSRGVRSDLMLLGSRAERRAAASGPWRAVLCHWKGHIVFLIVMSTMVVAVASLVLFIVQTWDDDTRKFLSFVLSWHILPASIVCMMYLSYEPKFCRSLRQRLVHDGIPICVSCGYRPEDESSEPCPQCGTQAD